MSRFLTRSLIVALVSLLVSFAITAQAAPFELRDGDRVVFIGGGFIERMQRHGYLEALLTTAYRDKNLTFRNLGWSGDNVWGESRGVFGLEAKGFERLVKDVKEAKPTVLAICYGANEAHAGEAGLPRFVEGLNKLLDTLADTQARVLFLSPYAYEGGHKRLPDPSPYNAKLQAYCNAIRRVAANRDAHYVSLVDLIEACEADQPLTSNGIHLTGEGYRLAAAVIAQRLDPQLTKADLTSNPREADRLKKLRDTIGLKNELYFYRYRPQNETYLFLFRKHEQGNNAVEIPQFDPLVKEQEKLIAKLKSIRANR